MSAVPFHLDHAIVSLARTPDALRALVGGLPEAWTHGTDGPETWSPHQVVAHLLHGERTDWTVRARIILEHGEARPFAPFDRAASIAEADHHPLDALLDAFAEARAANVAWLRGAGLTEHDLGRTGRHPALGVVSLRQLVATWVAHDHGHIVQIARTLARLYGGEVGPWAAYLSVFGGR